MANPWDFDSGTVWFTNCGDYPDFVGSECDSTLCPYVEDGQVRKMVTTITGLSHLNGLAIQVQMDGVVPDNNTFTVSGGSITLPEKAAVVHAGLSYEGTIQMLKPGGGAKIGSGQARMRRIYLTTLRLIRSLGVKVGIDNDHLDPIFDTDPALPLFTGDQYKVPNSTWTKEPELIIKQDKPLPAHVLSILTRAEVEEV